MAVRLSRKHLFYVSLFPEIKGLQYLIRYLSCRLYFLKEYTPGQKHMLMSPQTCFHLYRRQSEWILLLFTFHLLEASLFGAAGHDSHAAKKPALHTPASLLLLKMQLFEYYIDVRALRFRFDAIT